MDKRLIVAVWLVMLTGLTYAGESLYSFWVSPDKSGASYGYVGGGGPGFTGAIDTVGNGE